MELRERHVQLNQEDRRNLSALCEIFKAAHRYEQDTNDLINAIHAFAHRAAAEMLERDQKMLENIAEFAQQQAGQRLGDKFIFIGRRLRAQRSREEMLEQIRKDEEVTEHTDEYVYEAQREYCEKHTYEYLSKEAILDIASKYETAWTTEELSSPKHLVKYRKRGSLHTAAECMAAILTSDSHGTQARSFAEHLEMLDASGSRPDLADRHGALDDEATARAIIATTEELMSTWAPSQWHPGQSPAETQLEQDRTRLQRNWRRPRRQTYVRGGTDDQGKHTLSLEPSKQDKAHARQFFIPLNRYSHMDSCYSAVRTSGGFLFKDSTSIYDCINAQVCSTPLLAIFNRVRSLEDGTGIKVVDWSGETITVKILDKEKAKMNAEQDRELLQRLAPMEDQRKYSAVWFGDGGRKGDEGAPDRRVSWGAVVVWKGSSSALMRNYHLGALHPECDIQHGELMQIYKSTEFGLELLRQGHPVRMLCGSDSQTCADDVEAARSARNHRDLHDYDASIMIETIAHNIMTIESKGGIWDLFRVPGHSYTPNVIADALATAAQSCSQFGQDIDMKTDRAFAVLCDRTEAQHFWLQYDKGAKMFRYLRLRGQQRRVQRELLEFHAKHAKNLVAQVRHDQAHDLTELIKIKLKSFYGVPLSKKILEGKARTQAQEQLERDRDEMQKKLDTIIYPILNYDALPSLGVKTDTPRWTTAVEQFVAEPRLTRSTTRFNVSLQFANTALRTDASVIPGITMCPLCKRDVSPTVWHLITECTLKTCELDMTAALPSRVPFPMTAQDPTTSDDDATGPSALAARGSDAYLAQELEYTLRHFRPAGTAWPTALTETSEKNIFLNELEQACKTLESSCRRRQRDDDRGAPPALDNEGEIAKFVTLRFLACHLPRAPLATVFKVPKDEEGNVKKDQAKEMYEKRKAFFAVWERLHQLIAQAITQAKNKYNRMNATARAASREEDVPQFRDANDYQMNRATPERAELAEAQRGNRNERYGRRESTDLLELNQKNELQKKGNHINAIVATSQIGHVLQSRIDEHVTYSQLFDLPAKLTYDERISRWTRTNSDEPTGAGEEEGNAMDIGSTRNSSRFSYEDQEDYEADDDSSRRESAGSSLMSSRAVTPPPPAWEAATEDDRGDNDGAYDEEGDEGDGNEIHGGSGGKGGSNKSHGSSGGKGGNGGKGGSSGHRGADKGKGSSSRLHGSDDGKGSGRGLSVRSSRKGGSHKPRSDGSGKGGSGGHAQGGGKGKGGSSKLHGNGGSKGGGSGLSDDSSSKGGSSRPHDDGDDQGGRGRQHGSGKGEGGSRELESGKGDSSGLDDGSSSSARSKNSHKSAKHSKRTMSKKHQRADRRRESSSDSSAAQRPAHDARAEQREKKQKQE